MQRFVGLALTALVTYLLVRERKPEMPAVQKQFEQFHDAIKLEADNEKAKLQEKRDILLKALKAGLKEDDPGFESFHQGS